MIKQIIHETKKIFKDTLQHNNGKYSSKKLMTAQAFIICAVSFLFDTYVNKKVTYDLFLVFAMLSGYTSTLSAVANGSNRIIDNKLNEEIKTDSIQNL